MRLYYMKLQLERNHSDEKREIELSKFAAHRAHICPRVTTFAHSLARSPNSRELALRSNRRGIAPTMREHRRSIHSR